jgi:DNA-directed RNA polymerase subunit RPC12/RpoP
MEIQCDFSLRKLLVAIIVYALLFCFCVCIVFEVHMRGHRGKRTYTCDDCSRSFTKKSSLVIHYRIHSGERPYQCPECGKAFTTSSYLHVHRLIHSDEKPFQCELCEKYFKSRQLVKKHQMSHTGRKFECCKCKMTFKHKKSYKLHSKMECRVAKEFRWVNILIVWCYGIHCFSKDFDDSVLGYDTVFIVTYHHCPMPWLRLLFVCFLLWRPVLVPRPFHLRFVAVNRKVFCRIVVFCQYHLASAPYSFVIHFQRCVMVAVESAGT